MSFFTQKAERTYKTQVQDEENLPKGRGDLQKVSEEDAKEGEYLQNVSEDINILSYENGIIYLQKVSNEKQTNRFLMQKENGTYKR